jgi:hypothetical protein
MLISVLTTFFLTFIHSNLRKMLYFNFSHHPNQIIKDSLLCQIKFLV